MRPANRLLQVDSLRALAALAVVFLHAMTFAGLIYRDGVPRLIVGQMDVAVTVFFCISGYVLYRPFVRAHIAGTTPSIGVYSIRRILRIGPAYWVALAIAAVVLGWSYVFTPTGFINYFGFLYLYSGNPLSAINPGWSLCVEFSFYVFLPIWAWSLRQARAREESDVLRLHLIGLAGLMAFSAVYTVLVLKLGGIGDVHPAGTWQIASLPTKLSDFAIGMLLAVLSIKWAGGKEMPDWAEKVRARPGLMILGAALLFAAAVAFIKHDFTGVRVNNFFPYYDHKNFGLRMILFWGISALIMFPAVFPKPGSLVDRALSMRWLAALGLISFGMYLWHWPLVELFSEHTNLKYHTDTVGYLEWTIATVTGTIILATLSYLLVERPAMNWANRLTGGSRSGGRAPASAPIAQPEKS